MHISSVPDEVNDCLLTILEGKYFPMHIRTATVKKAYYYLYSYRKYLIVKKIENPLTMMKEKRIIFQAHSQQPIIVLKDGEKVVCIKFFYERSKGDGARKLKRRISQIFCTVSEKDIQDFINNQQANQAIKTIFDNKPPLKPVSSSKVWERVQIDLMSMADIPCEDKSGNVHQWVLSCIDVFSRYLVLRPLHSKDTALVSSHLLQIFSDFGTPAIIQSDRGSEFKGAVEEIARLL